MKVQQVSPGIINKVKSLIARVGYLKSDIGIVEDTDTATHTISSGQYVIWKNELYKASAAIPSGDPLSSANLTAVSDGIANELNSNIATLNSSKARIQDAVTSSSSTTVEFDASNNQCYILLSYYRSNSVSTSDGIVFIKIYNNTAFISCKLQANDITTVSFNDVTNKLTVTVGSYRSCRLIG